MGYAQQRRWLFSALMLLYTRSITLYNYVLYRCLELPYGTLCAPTNTSRWACNFFSVGRNYDGR